MTCCWLGWRTQLATPNGLTTAGSAMRSASISAFAAVMMVPMARSERRRWFVSYMVGASVSILSQEFIYFVVPLLVVLIGTGTLQKRQMPPAQVPWARPGG